jgi:hypothetical protein
MSSINISEITDKMRKMELSLDDAYHALDASLKIISKLEKVVIAAKRLAQHANREHEAEDWIEFQEALREVEGS